MLVSPRRRCSIALPNSSKASSLGISWKCKNKLLNYFFTNILRVCTDGVRFLLTMVTTSVLDKYG